MATLKNDQIQLHAQTANPVGGTNIAGTTQFYTIFTPSVSGTLDKVTIAGNKAGSPPGNFEFAVKAVSASKPTGADLAMESIAPGSIPTGSTDPSTLVITFSSPATLVAGTQYALVARQAGGAGDLFNAYRWFTSSSTSEYAGGNGGYSLDSGANWTTQTYDHAFVTTMSVAVTTPGLDQFCWGANPNGSAERITANTEQKAQTFIPSLSVPLKKVRLHIHRLDGQTTGNMIVDIKGVDGSNKPTGAALATQTVPDTSIPSTVANLLEVTFTTPATLTLGTTYAIVLRFPDASGAARYSIAHNSSVSAYASGQNWVSTDSGSTWNSDAGALDLAFGTFMEEPDTTITGLRIDKFSLNADQIDLATNVTVNGPSVDDEWYAQTFAPSVTGNLKKVYICARRLSAASSGDMQLAIKATSGGVPTGADLGTANVPSSAFPDTNTEDHMQTFDFGAGVPLTSGVTYAIVGRALTNGNYRWRSAATGTLFSGGQAYYSLDGGANWTSQSSEDLTFATEMDVTIAQPGIDQFGFGNTVGGANDRVESTAEYRAQTFIPKISEKLKGVKLGIRRADSQTGETMTIEIQNTTGGAPNGTVIATQTFNDTAIPTASKVITDWNFTIAPTLVAGTTYAIVIKFSNASVSRTYEIMHNDDGTGGTSGSHWKSTDSGANWVENSGPNDLLYATIMFAPTVTTQTILSDAVVQLTTEQTILSDAFHGAITTQTIPSDATIFITSEQTILSDAFHGAITTQTIFSDASVGVTQSVDIFSDAFVGQETNQTIFSDATIFVTEEEIILSDAIVFITSLQTIDSNANIFASIVQTINANASVAMTTSQTITGGAVITVREPVLKMFVVV